jgi:hypothetical protein
MSTELKILASDFQLRYISLVKHHDLQEALQRSTKSFQELFRQITTDKTEYAYAEGKWTLKQMLQHLVDAERVFALRAVWFARQDPSPLPGFDEHLWGMNANVSSRSWDGLFDEFVTLRQATEMMFASFGEKELNSTGIANNQPITVAAIGYIAAGHLMHHLSIVKERYL